MRKKYLSRILLGGLIIASTVTLNSCKDYDDDIADLQEQIDANAAAIDDLEDLISSGSVITSVTSVSNGIQITLSNGSSYTITNGEDGAAGSVVSIGSDGYWYIDGVSTGLQAEGQDGADGADGTDGTNGEDGEDGIYYVPNAETGTFWVVNPNTGETYDSGISFLSDNTTNVTTSITAIDTDDYVTLVGVIVNGVETNITLYKNNKLRSLVFSPELYWGGIEAIEVAYYNYEELTLSAVTADGDYSTDEPTYSETYINVAPLVYAEYYLNPSNASIKTDVSYYSYTVNHAQTRALSSTSIDIKNVERTDGIIEVSFKIQDAGISALLANGDDEIDVAALQYTQSGTNGDTIITSDFAALYVDEITEFNINCVTEEGAVDTEDPATYGHQHLATTAADAISDYESNGSTYPVLYVNYLETINLDENINVHKGTSDILWGGQTTLAESDFYMTYELIGWLHGANETSESVHAALSDEDGDGIITETFTPTPIDGAAAVTTAGRAPMVRVTLWDNNDSSNPHIAAVGYIIIEITEEEAQPEEVSTAITLDTEYELACGSDDVTVSTKWNEMEVQLYTLVGLSKTNFEATYELETSNSEAVQYDASYTALATSDYIGTITLTDTDDASTQTNVLEWAISNTEAYAAFVTNGQSEVVTYIKFVSSDSAYPDIYVALTWAPSNAPISGLTATIANSSKIAADWHANNSRNSGYLDIHFEVGNPTDPSATDDYDPLVVNETFISGYTPYETIYTTVNNYSSTLAASLSTDVYTFEVTQDVTSYTTTQGNTYNTYVDSATSIGVKDTSGTYTELATLDQTTGKVTLVESDILKEILNSPDYGDYETSLTFTIGLVATTCDPAGSDFITATFASGEDIDVIVVKPLYVTEAKVEGMQWNDYSSLTQEIAITLYDYNGYDDTTFFTKSTGLSTIDEFYGITALSIDYSNITDTYDGTVNSYYGDKYDITDNISISADATTGAVTFGTITLEQLTSSRSNAFEIYLPVILTYDWGDIYATVTVYVQAASGN